MGYPREATGTPRFSLPNSLDWARLTAFAAVEPSGWTEGRDLGVKFFFKTNLPCSGGRIYSKALQFVCF